MSSHRAAPQPAPHRADIEGLRGLAVLAVVAVHAWPEALRGGFVGVDIFFVLSGYLITGLMLDAMAQGRFSLADFYRRRVLRLFPALCTVLLCCALVAVFTFPSEARQIGKHIAASAVFASNLALWQEAGYFDASSDSKPLLHLWSLGIEEQFYLLWPLMLLAAWRWRKHLPLIVLALLLLSFALNVMWVVPKAKGTFFLLPTRAWELLLGAALVILQQRGSGAPMLAAVARRLSGLRSGRGIGFTLHDAAAGCGVLLIAAAFLLLDKHSVFPGWWALLPTLGTVLLLAAGTRTGTHIDADTDTDTDTDTHTDKGAWVNRALLSHPVMVFYGRISYPLYLWHWPLLVFPVLLGWEMDNALRVLVLTASVGLAALTTEYIERPLRHGAHGWRVPLVLGGVMAGTAVAGLVLMLTDGLVRSYPRSVQEIAKADFAFDFGSYRSQRCFLDLEQGPSAYASECWPGADQQRPLTLLWGDSHAASLYPGLAGAMSEAAAGASSAGASGASDSADGRQRRFLAQFTKARCPPVAQLPALASRRCGEANEHVLALLRARVPDTVVLGGDWWLYAKSADGAAALLASLRNTVEQLHILGVREVIVLGQLPTWTLPLPRVLLREWERQGSVPQRSLAALDRKAWLMDAGVRLAVAGTAAVFVSPFDQLCNAQGCLVSQTVDGVSQPLVHDESHLTVAGSVALVSLLRLSNKALFH